MSLLDKLTLEDLDGDQRELAECIGLEAYKNLLQNYAGSDIRVRMPKRLLIPMRDREIRENFNGYNHRELGLQYELSISSIRRIVSPVIPKIKAAPLPGQVSFFNDDEDDTKI